MKETFLRALGIRSGSQTTYSLENLPEFQLSFTAGSSIRNSIRNQYNLLQKFTTLKKNFNDAKSKDT